MAAKAEVVAALAASASLALPNSALVGAECFKEVEKVVCVKVATLPYPVPEGL